MWSKKKKRRGKHTKWERWSESHVKDTCCPLLDCKYSHKLYPSGIFLRLILFMLISFSFENFLKKSCGVSPFYWQTCRCHKKKIKQPFSSRHNLFSNTTLMEEKKIYGRLHGFLTLWSMLGIQIKIHIATAPWVIKGCLVFSVSSYNVWVWADKENM